MEILKENVTTYISGKGSMSAIAQQGFANKLNSLWGWRSAQAGSTDHVSKTAGVEFVSVNPDALNNTMAQNNPLNAYRQLQLSERAEKLFDSWLRDNTVGYDDLRDRQKRIKELAFMYYNDSFVSRVTELVADEATQLDVQDRLISVESADSRMTESIYALLNRIGVTQQELWGACFDIELYGEAFWALSVTDKGVEAIQPLRPNQIEERLEFNASQVAEKLKYRNGALEMLANRDMRMQQLLKSIEDPQIGYNFAELFERKLFGFSLDKDTVVPPWLITHFRFAGNHSEFFPYGKPPLLACLAPFKQAASTMTLQSLARIMSFPVTLYKVKTTPGMDPALVWNHVNMVREQYDNIGVNPVSGQTETYSVNTKIWIPDGLLEIDVKDSKTDIGFIDDLELYQDRVAIASKVPKGYVLQEWGGFGASSISLTEQFKPFGRHVYSVQSTLLEGIADIIRLHFVVTGEFDYRAPFTLSMRFPAEEMSDDKRSARTASLDLTSAVYDTLKNLLGLEDDEGLPEEVVVDLLNKFSFLDPTDVLRWSRQIKTSSLLNVAAGGGDGEGGDDGGSALDDLDMDFGGGDDAGVEEARKGFERERLLHELNSQHAKAQNRLQEERLKMIEARYKEAKNDIYMEVLQKHQLREFKRAGSHVKLSEGSYSGLDKSKQAYFDILESTKVIDGKFYKKKLTLRESYDKMKEDYGLKPESTLDFDKLSTPLRESQEHLGVDMTDKIAISDNDYTYDMYDEELIEMENIELHLPKPDEDEEE